uniref:HP domain-containing protein n=1 Tax=Anopheles culicifacies TaxID=139723 RepID=A0A182M9S8_9DIPT
MNHPLALNGTSRDGGISYWEEAIALGSRIGAFLQTLVIPLLLAIGVQFVVQLYNSTRREAQRQLQQHVDALQRNRQQLIEEIKLDLLRTLNKGTKESDVTGETFTVAGKTSKEQCSCGAIKNQPAERELSIVEKRVTSKSSAKNDGTTNRSNQSTTERRPVPSLNATEWTSRRLDRKECSNIVNEIIYQIQSGARNAEDGISPTKSAALESGGRAGPTGNAEDSAVLRDVHKRNVVARMKTLFEQPTERPKNSPILADTPKRQLPKETTLRHFSSVVNILRRNEPTTCTSRSISASLENLRPSGGGQFPKASSEPPTLIRLRRRIRSQQSLSESVEDILESERFSKRLSQYSISDLLDEEEPDSSSNGPNDRYSGELKPSTGVPYDRVSRGLKTLSTFSLSELLQDEETAADGIEETEVVLRRSKVSSTPTVYRNAVDNIEQILIAENLSKDYWKYSISNLLESMEEGEDVAKSSNLAVEALAGLASVEDFKSVSLKSSSLPLNQSFVPYKPLMLLQVKGRRHAQTRLVEPVARSVNRGDCFILVTADRLYAFLGQYANVIERSRCKEICDQIVRDKDLGCGATAVTLLSDGASSAAGRQAREFWTLLGRGQEDEGTEVCDSGHADEDELFEACLIETNMVYEFEDDALVPVAEYWGAIPKIAMLDPRKVLVFDFGSELYVWSGKNAPSEGKRAALRLAQELYGGGYSYEECQLNPVNFSELAGDRQRDARRLSKVGNNRPDWCLIARVTQHMETVLFREKFLDWPDMTMHFREEYTLGAGDGSTPIGADIKPLDGNQLYRGNEPYQEPNLVLENSNLGRGDFYYDQDSMRHFDVCTTSVTQWEIDEYEYKEIDGTSRGHFYADESYTVRWMYQISVTVRELSGKVSNRSTVVGRDRCAYFCWHGKDASANEKGAAALLTVELDKEKGAQVRVAQGQETAAFVRLFKVMFVHRSKRVSKNGWRLYMIAGNCAEETMCTEVEGCSMRQLRSRATMLLVHGERGRVLLWQGCKALPHAKEVAANVLRTVLDHKCSELFDETLTNLSSAVMDEGHETSEFFDAVGGQNRHHYHSLLGSEQCYDFTPRIFHLTSINNGNFEATELQYALRAKDRHTAYPFRQEDLYSARQPTIFLIDNGHVLWLWQGWWPTNGDESGSDSGSGGETNHSSFDSNRSGENRWQVERRVAMETAVSYWKAKHHKQQQERVVNGNGHVATTRLTSTTVTTDENGNDEGMDEVDAKPYDAPVLFTVQEQQQEEERTPNDLVHGFVVWAGLEPLEFTAMFPEWTERDDVAEINVQDGRKSTPQPIYDSLSLLSRKEYPLAVLLERPLPEGVDPTKLELYLHEQDYPEALGLTKPEYDQLPAWKQTKLKKERGLF